jgi:hypothetical protein
LFIEDASSYKFVCVPANYALGERVIRNFLKGDRHNLGLLNRPAARATGPLAKARWAGLRYVFRLSRVTIGPVVRDWRKFPNWLGRIENSQAGNAETRENAGRTKAGNFRNPKSVVWENSQVFNPEREQRLESV